MKYDLHPIIWSVNQKAEKSTYNIYDGVEFHSYFYIVY
jgi:hypothetical protein